MTSNVQSYPPGLARCLVMVLQTGGLLIEREGLVQANAGGKVILTAVDMEDHWRVDLRGCIHEVAKG